jgi:cytoskeletal protein RodZ
MDDTHPDEPAAAGDAPSVGALLAEARAARGRDLEQIARETRVPLRHLMAIEADDHDALPALPYALGFVKAFARAVGLEPEAVGARFRAETRLAPHVPTPSTLAPVDEARLPSRGLAWGAFGMLVLVLVGLGLYGAGVFDPAPQPDSVEVASPQPAPAAKPAAPVADPAANTGLAQAEPGQPEAAPPAAAPPAAAPSPTATPGTIPASGTVTLTARQDVWLRIYDRATGRRAFMGVLSTGESWTVPAGQTLAMRTGRAGVIDVRVGGVLLPPLGDTNQTMDGIVLTAPALAERFAGVPLPPARPSVSPPARPSLSPPPRTAVQVPDMPAAPQARR